MKFNYLIVDDEPFARKLVQAHASKIESLELVGECANAIEASNLLRAKSVNLIFLDIHMPELSGLDFIKTLKNPPAIILITAHRDFAIEAFDLNVIDYLLKPISFDRFLKGVNKFFDRHYETSKPLNQNDSTVDFIYLKADRKNHKIRLNEILYIESLDDYVKVFLRGRVLITRENISTLEEKLSGLQFVRIHRSYIVSVKEIRSISGEGVQIADKDLPFGRAYKKTALTSLSIQEKKVWSKP